MGTLDGDCNKVFTILCYLQLLVSAAVVVAAVILEKSGCQVILYLI